MTDEPAPKVTREGLFEELVGKTKQAAGELVGNEALAQAGREQQADAQAEDPAPAPAETPGSDDTEGGG